MKSLIIGPYTTRQARDRYGKTLRNRHPGGRILFRQHGAGFYIEHFHCYQVLNSAKGILTLEEWVKWHKSQKKNKLAGLTSAQLIDRYWNNYIPLHKGSKPTDKCVKGMTSSWPPKDYGTLPPLGYRQAACYGSRNGAKIQGIVMHESQGGFNSLVNWFLNPSSGVSAHLCIREDGGQVTQMVSYGTAAWHAKGVNSHTIGIELAGYVATANDPRQIANAARVVAWLCWKYKIPVKRADNRGRGGIATHRQLIGNDHTDPDLNGPLAGDGFPAFIEQVRNELNIGRFPTAYGR